MKRIFSIALVALLAIFTACDNEGDIVVGKNLQCTSSNMLEVPADGGTAAILYTIKNHVSGATVIPTVKGGSEAVKSITQPAEGVILVEVSKNTTSKSRIILINVSYDSDSFDVVINQKSVVADNDQYDVVFEAAHLDGYYYGQEYGEGADLYAFFISDKGMNNAGQIFANGTYYYIYAFAPVSNSTTLPNGTYNYSANATFTQFTIVGQYSKLYYTGTGADDTVEMPITDGKMVVSSNNVVLEVTIDGKSHKVLYNGSLALIDANESDDGGDTGGDSGNNNNPTGGQDGEAKSTYTSDHHVTFDGEHRAKWGYEGDYWNTGYSNYTIYIMNKSNGYVYGDTLQFDLITDNKSQDGDFDGKYTISNNPGKMVMMAGFTNNYAQSVGSWLYEYGGASASGYANYAMLKSGSAEFIKNSDGTHTVKLNAYDCLGNNITCNWTGVIEKD